VGKLRRKIPSIIVSEFNKSDKTDKSKIKARISNNRLEQL